MPATPRPTPRQIAEGLGALAVLGAGLVGLPVVLATAVGWPLPHHIPSGAQLAQALHASIPDAFWPHLFATLAWLAWAYFSLSVATNLIAHLQGRRRNQLATRGAVATLITAVMVLGQLRSTPTARDAAPAVVALVVDIAPANGAPPAATAAAVVHTVVEGDTLWGIAATYYGDGERWQAIYQANAGAPQPGGGALSDAHWIYPGWTLVIPDVSERSAPSAPGPMAAPRPPVPAPVTPTTTAGTHHGATGLARAARSAALPNAQTHAAPGGHSRHTPAAGSPPVHTSPAIHHDAARQTPAGSHATGGTQHPAVAGHGDDVATLAIGAGVFGLGAIALVRALDRRRRRQGGRRAPGRRIPLPASRSSLAELELQLRHYARADSLFWLTRLPDLLARSAENAGTAHPQVLGVHLRLDGVDVLVASGAGDPPVPFEPRPGDPSVWHLPTTTDPGFLDDTVAAEPVPLTLATVGRGPEGTLAVNLDHYRRVHVCVDADQVPHTLAAIAADLSAGSGPRAARVIAVGFGRGVIDRLDDCTVTDDLADNLAHLRPHERTVVLVDAAALPDQVADLAADTETLRLVTAGPIAPAGVGLVFDPADPILTGRHFHRVEPAQVAQETLVGFDALLDLAEAPADASPDDQPYNTVGVPATPLDALPVGAVTLGLLGEPTIAVGDGEPRDLLAAVSPTAGTKARRVVELLVYLGAHDGSATRGQWLTDVSAEKALSDGYIRNLVLLTRRSLEAVTGVPDLLTYDRTTQRLSLAVHVGTDWTAFRSLSASGDPEDLGTALALVRGSPFGSNPEPWTSAAGHSYVMAADIADTAAALGEHALSIDESQLATWAARQGHLANRYDQALWRILLQAAGDLAARQRIWEELQALLAIDGDAVSDLDPATVDLYNALNTPAPPISEVVVLQDDDDAVIPTRQAV